MLISLKDKKDNLLVKDMLDIDFDMSVSKEGDKYYINVNPLYRLAESFTRKEDAENEMLSIARSRNNLEDELRNY